jgi:hypothetical protein
MTLPVVIATARYSVLSVNAILVEGNSTGAHDKQSSEKGDTTNDFSSDVVALDSIFPYASMNEDSYVLDNLISGFSRNLSLHGCCILRGEGLRDAMKRAKAVLKPIISQLKSCYDYHNDEFTGLSDDEKGLEELNLVRLPRIGRGKHNIHFDPFESDCHRALVDLAERAGLTQMLTCHANSTSVSIANCRVNDVDEADGDEVVRKVCSIRETGMSMTRPVPSSVSSSPSLPHEQVIMGDDGMFMGGDGMEWHSDGSRGEYTVLTSLDADIEENIGTLGMVPGSHLEFVEGVGHGDVSTLVVVSDINLIVGRT